ncbi:13678_t:CDS:2 [Ambispora gerdemannii]|uniref:Large ribosomal subunit protein mL43 n=1 Tax=Ambispora gerdemannii TaxID=144530 RepID=A0A9N8VA62_9GLOM|nr:13678_t:CDS:2 [Ambispora gerdemannii]
MPSISLKKPTVTYAKNGVGSYVLQCRKMVFHYCERGGSSRGMIEYLKKDLIPFAKANPEVEIMVKPRPSRHPCIRGWYLNGRDKVICVRKMKASEIGKVAEYIRDHSGQKATTRFKKPVISTTESVRGIWSAFHTQKHVI